MRTLVMGGTRFLGIETVEALLARGHDVTVFHRGSRSIEWSRPVTQVLGDRDHIEGLSKLRNHNFDAVVDLSAYSALQTELLLETLPDVKRWVHASTLNVYSPTDLLPWTEQTPEGPYPLWGRYAVEKIGCERALRRQREGMETVALRFPLVLGPGNYLAREEFVLNRLLDGAEILIPGDGQAVHQYVWIGHAAAALAKATELPALGYAAYNIASRRCLTSIEGFVRICAEVSGTTPAMRFVGGGPTGENLPVFNGVDCVFPFSNENTIGDTEAAERAGLLSPFKPLSEMIDEALKYLVVHPERREWHRTDAESRVLSSLVAG